MWEHIEPWDTVLVTTNGILSRGRLVMGAGAAAELVRRWPNAPEYFGRIIGRSQSTYGVVIEKTLGYGIFQTKHHWQYASNLDLIAYSTACLTFWATDPELEPQERFFLNYPGIGLGQLSKPEVFPIIERLPDNVIIWELP